MKKIFKRTITCIALVTVLFSITTLPAGAVSVGSVIGHAQPTDIVATINGYQLESYNVNNLTYICVEDLRYYGFDVVFDPYTKSLSFSRNYNVSQIDPQNTNPNFWSIGVDTGWKSILYTDIVTYADGQYVEGRNINGRTIINFNDLSRFGAVAYDDSRREISLTLDGVNQNIVDLFAKELQKLTENSSPEWKIIYRAKGDLFMLIGTSRSYMTQAEKDAFISESIPGDKLDAKELLDKLHFYNIPASAVYVEYKNTDGSLVTSYQVY